MPTSARKSSLGTARRGPQKAHIPYRGDNPEVGKKTGIAVEHVEPKSDGFEPFEEVMQQADGRTPPRPKGRKKSIAAVANPDYDEEDGEMSMQLDSPVNYLTSIRPPSTPTTLSRVGLSSRPVARTSDVDFDHIPSPKPRSHSKANYGPGPSNLSKSTHRREVEPESDSPDEAGGYDEGGYDMDDGNGDFDDYGPQETSPGERTPKQTSFTQMDQDDEQEEEEREEEEEEPPEETPTKNRRDKGKGRAVVEEEQQDEDMEDDVAQALEDLEQGPYSDEEEEEEEEPEVRPKAKKVKLPEAATKPRTETRSKGKKENKSYREGVRKSAREHYKPLEWWRGEKLVYGRSDDSGSKVLVPPIREIVRIPREEPLPLGKRKRGTTRARSRSAKPGSVPPVAVAAFNPEEGWDDETPESCEVLVYGSDSLEPTTRRIGWTAKMFKPKPAANADWSFDKIFGDGDFIAAGQLVIPPKGRKPSKASKDNTYVFYVVQGAVNLKIHDTSLVFATGGMFMVPRGNTYFIENICDRDAKLFFTQARKVAPNPEEIENEARHAAAKKALTRSSSAGPIGTPGQANGRARSKTTGPPPASKAVARAASTRI